MRINSLHTHLANELRKTDGAARKTESTPAKAAAKGDSVGLSAGGARSLQSVKADAAVVTASIAATPDVRMDRVEEVKQRVASGYYNTPEFADKLADKLARDFGSKGSI